MLFRSCIDISQNNQTAAVAFRPSSYIFKTPKEDLPFLSICGLCDMLINAYNPPCFRREGPFDLQVENSTIHRCSPVRFQDIGRAVEVQLFSV